MSHRKAKRRRKQDKGGRYWRELSVATVVYPEDKGLIIHAGKRHLKLSVDELERYIGERALRGLKLPRGFQQVHAVEVA